MESMGSRGWRAYAIVVLLAVAGYLLAPRSSWWETTIPLLVGWSGAGAILIGMRQLPRRRRSPWLLLALGVFCSSVAGIPEHLGLEIIPGAGPDITDYLYLAFYPACAVALVLMLRDLRRRPDRAALIDALTVTVGIGLPAWVYALQPALHDDVGSLTERIVRVTYPIADLVLLFLTVLLLRSNGRRGGNAPLWIGVAVFGYLIGDWAWVVLGTLHNGWDDLWWTSRTISGVYMLSLAVLGLAAWRPEMHDDGPGASAVSRLSHPQLAVLAAAVLIAPAMLVAETLDGQVRNGLAVAIGSATMFLLVVVRMAQLLKQAERHSLQVRELSRRDELTGLPNRRAWTGELPRVLEQARSGGEPVSIAMIDLDRFKSFNDRHGHPAGDRLLKEAAAAWTGALRRSDILARYGGEEFIVLLPGADTGQAVAAIERVRAVTPAGQTFSAGVATWDGEESSDDLVSRADTYLYAAKKAGRDRILSGSEPGPSAVAQI